VRRIPIAGNTTDTRRGVRLQTSLRMGGGRGHCDLHQHGGLLGGIVFVLSAWEVRHARQGEEVGEEVSAVRCRGFGGVGERVYDHVFVVFDAGVAAGAGELHVRDDEHAVG